VQLSTHSLPDLRYPLAQVNDEPSAPVGAQQALATFGPKRSEQAEQKEELPVEYVPVSQTWQRYPSLLSVR